MCTRNKFFNKVILFIFTAGLIISPAILLAQDEACQGQDPTGNNTTCPLDTWVWVLVIAAAIFGAVILSRKQKLQGRI
jgi:hypothetical protein